MKITYNPNGVKLCQYASNNTSLKKYDYVGPFVYNNGLLSYIITSEGRAVFNNNKLNYFEYHIKDHLGNVRVVFQKLKSGNSYYANVVQKNDYYPFGMLMGSTYQANTTSKNKYLYNGKELISEYDIELNWYDYEARIYDAQLGRFNTQDAFAEKYINFSIYQYATNNPILFIDINSDSIQATSDVILAIYHALDKNTNVKFDVKDGKIDPKSFKEQAENSDDIVLKDLYEIANNEKMVELSVSAKETYKDKEGNIVSTEFNTPFDFDIKDLGPVVYKQLKDMGEPDGKTVMGNLGVTLLPDPNVAKRSLNNNIQVIINAKGSLNHRAIGIAHEFGHVVLYLRGLPHGHGQPGVDKAVYNERSDVVKKRLGYDY